MSILDLTTGKGHLAGNLSAILHDITIDKLYSNAC